MDPISVFKFYSPLKNYTLIHAMAIWGITVPAKTFCGRLAFIGVLIIIMASINFINLSTAQSMGAAGKWASESFGEQPQAIDRTGYG